jgi:ABC-type phosphate/phosphonate transport system substrate-binding protein
MEGDAGSRRQWSLVSLGDVDVSVVKRSSVSLVEWNQTEKIRNYWESLSCATGCDASPILVQQ